MPAPLPLAQAVGTRIGAGAEETRQIVIDFVGENLKPVPAADIKAKVAADTGTLRNIVVHPNPEIAGTRVSFQLSPGGEKAVELRAQLVRGDDPLSEVWVYRWTP